MTLAIELSGRTGGVRRDYKREVTGDVTSVLPRSPWQKEQESTPAREIYVKDHASVIQRRSRCYSNVHWLQATPAAGTPGQKEVMTFHILHQNRPSGPGQ